MCIFYVSVCFLPSVWILWSSVSGMSNSSWPLLLAVRDPTANGLKTWWQFSSDSFCHFMYTSGKKDSRGHPEKQREIDNKSNRQEKCKAFSLCCKVKSSNWNGSITLYMVDLLAYWILFPEFRVTCVSDPDNNIFFYRSFDINHYLYSWWREWSLFSQQIAYLQEFQWDGQCSWQ